MMTQGPNFGIKKSISIFGYIFYIVNLYNMKVISLNLHSRKILVAYFIILRIFSVQKLQRKLSCIILCIYITNSTPILQDFQHLFLKLHKVIQVATMS